MIYQHAKTEDNIYFTSTYMPLQDAAFLQKIVRANITVYSIPKKAKDKSLFVCLFLLLYVPCQQLWSLRDGQFT